MEAGEAQSGPSDAAGIPALFFLREFRYFGKVRFQGNSPESSESIILTESSSGDSICCKEVMGHSETTCISGRVLTSFNP
eukprot:symbB.v1.2.025006.t1/scaffold2406.1/size85596/3